MRQAADPRIVITGIGVVSPFGVGRERFWDAVSRGCSGTRAITEFDASEFACRVAAPVSHVTMDEVPALAGDDVWDADYRADPKRYSRAALIGVIAAREAWADAGLRIAEPNAGVVIGSGGGGIDVGERQYYDFFLDRGKKVTPYAIPISIVGMVSSEISISLRLRGVSHVLSCGCTSSTDAIGYAASLLRSGQADVIMSGGTDACVTPGMIFGFSRMKAVSMAYNDCPAHASRPFDRGRDGFVLGDHADRLAGSSVKSMIGHPQGASGAAGVVTAALALSRGYLPPTINQRDPDPACDLDVIPNEGRAAEVEAALCNCLGFGSKNSAIVIGRAQ